jgi:hypothetical protein
MPTSQDTWREIRRCHDAADAESLVSRLAAAGIPAIVPPPQTMGRQPMCRPRADPVRVLVRDCHAAAAEAELRSRGVPAASAAGPSA